MGEIELKPCPFCGGKVHLLFWDEDDQCDKVWESEDDANVSTYIQCHKCETYFTHSDGQPNDTKRWWNRRSKE